MGCASSSPFISAGTGIMDTAKTAANDIKSAGESTLHDVGETINETVEHVKDAVVGAVHSVGHAVGTTKEDIQTIPGQIENKMDELTNDSSSPIYKHIPLKDTALDPTTIKENIDAVTAQAQTAIADESEKLADDLMKETQDVVTDAEAQSTDILRSMQMELSCMENQTPTHSIADSLKTDTPEPEIVNALANDDNSSKSGTESPKPTIREMQIIQKELKKSPVKEAAISDEPTEWEMRADAILKIPSRGLGGATRNKRPASATCTRDTSTSIEHILLS